MLSSRAYSDQATSDHSIQVIGKPSSLAQAMESYIRQSFPHCAVPLTDRLLKRNETDIHALFGDIERLNRTIGDEYERLLFLWKVKYQDHSMDCSGESAAGPEFYIQIRTSLAAAAGPLQGENPINVDDDDIQLEARIPARVLTLTDGTV